MQIVTRQTGFKQVLLSIEKGCSLSRGHPFRCGVEMAKSGEERKKRKEKEEAANGHGDAPQQAKKSKDKKKKASRENGREEAHENAVKAANLGDVTAEGEKSDAHHFDLVKGGQGVLLGCRYELTWTEITIL